MAGEDLRKGSGESAEFPIGAKEVVAMFAGTDPRVTDGFLRSAIHGGGMECPRIVYMDVSGVICKMRVTVERSSMPGR
jgi:hypothetical protein